jgi:hypothetical protein
MKHELDNLLRRVFFYVVIISSLTEYLWKREVW